MDEREILRRTKEVLLGRGWYQGQFCADPLGDEGRVCLMGAIGVARNGNPYCHAGIGEAMEALAGIVGPRTVPTWNDDCAESVDDVIALIDRALASLEPSPQEETREVAHAAA